MQRLTPLSSLLITLLMALPASSAWAQTNSAPPHSRAGLAQLGDPYVPPHVRAAARAKLLASPVAHASLQAQAMDKLRRQFDAADPDRVGRVSKAQAQQAGFGFIVNHFEQIDTRRQGRVSFNELKAFMRANGARLR